MGINEAIEFCGGLQWVDRAGAVNGQYQCKSYSDSADYQASTQQPEPMPNPTGGPGHIVVPGIAILWGLSAIRAMIRVRRNRARR